MASCQKVGVISGTDKPTSKPFAYKTVPIGEALALFSNTNTSPNKSNGGLNLQPDLNAIKQVPIQYTMEYMTNIPAVTKNKNINTNIILIKYKDSIIRSLINLIPAKESNSQKFSGIVSITTLSGKFINGYRLKDGVFVSQFIKLNTKNISGKTLTDPIVACDESLDPSSIFCDQSLGETDLGSVPVSTDSYSSEPVLSINVTTDIPFTVFSVPDYYTSGGSNNSDSSGSGSVAVYPCNDPIHGCSIDSLPPTTSKPCPGNPVKNPEIVSSGASGKKGGTFGCTRADNTTCGGVYGRKKHDGLDIKADVNENAFAMYSGTISSIRNTFSPGEYKKDSYGNFVVITTVINGITYNIKYNHLNSVSVVKGQTIKVGDIIGLTGNTGNANPPNSKVIPHIHLQVFNSNWSQSLNPEIYLQTKFDSNYNAISNNCQ